jgi:hypothetical protein
MYHASYSILRNYHAGMNDNIERTKEDSKKPSQRGDNNKNQLLNVSRDIKKRIDEAITKPNIDGDPTRSDE